MLVFFIIVLSVALGAALLEFCIAAHAAHNLAPIIHHEEHAHEML